MTDIAKFERFYWWSLFGMAIADAVIVIAASEPVRLGLLIAVNTAYVVLTLKFLHQRTRSESASGMDALKSDLERTILSQVKAHRAIIGTVVSPAIEKARQLARQGLDVSDILGSKARTFLEGVAAAFDPDLIRQIEANDPQVVRS